MCTYMLCCIHIYEITYEEIGGQYQVFSLLALTLGFYFGGRGWDFCFLVFWVFDFLKQGFSVTLADLELSL